MEKVSISKVKVKEMFEAIAGLKNLLIFLHDNPDPDAIASGYALQRLIMKKTKLHPRLCAALYTGRPENTAMIRRLNIKIMHPSEANFRIYKSIAAVDTQPSAGNNSIPEGLTPKIVIDHHPLNRTSMKSPFTDIRTDIGATSTILAEYYATCGIKPDKKVATALLYGIKTDTINLSRSATVADIRAHTYLIPLVHRKKLSQIEVPPLDGAHYSSLIRGILNARLYGELIFADLDVITNIDEVAQTADLLIRNEGSKYSIVMGTFGDNTYISMRMSNGKKSSEKILKSIIGRRGNAGGHGRAAGGRIPLKGLSEEERRTLKQSIYRKIFDVFSKKEDEYSFLVPRSMLDYLSSANIPQLPVQSDDKDIREKIGML